MQLDAHKVVGGPSLLSSSLRVYLNNKKRLQPIIGLSCMAECVKHSGGSDVVYLCEVCVCRLGKADVRSHIMGSLHRYNYIKVHHRHFVSEWKQSTELSKMARPLMEMAQILENREGPGDVQVLKFDVAMFEEITSHSESDVQTLLHAIKTEQKQREPPSQSEKALARTECLAIQSQRTVISPRRLKTTAVQMDSQRGGLVHGRSPLIGASVSVIPRPHDNHLSLIHDDVTAGGQMLLGGSVGEGWVGQDGVPAKLIRCEPVFKVSLSLTDGPLLLERNSFSLEPSPASTTHSPSVDASPGNTQTVEYIRTVNVRVDPARHNQQLTVVEEQTITDHGLYIMRDQDGADRLFSKNTQFTEAKFDVCVELDNRLRSTDPGAGDMITDLVSVGQPGLLTAGHHSGCVEEESLTNTPPMDKEQEEATGNVCYSARGLRHAVDNWTTDCLYSIGERIADSGYSTGSRSTDRRFQTVESSTDSQYFIAEVTNDRVYATGDGQTDRVYATGDGQTDHVYATGDVRTDRVYATGDVQTDRVYATGDGPTDRGYATGDGPTDREYATGDVRTDRVYATGDGRTNRVYATGDGPTDRVYATGDGPTDRGYATGDGRTDRVNATGQGRTERKYPTGQGRTERGYPTGQGQTERGYPTGKGRTERGYPTGDRRTERRYPTGDRRTERGYPTGQGRTERGYPTGDRRTERWYPTGQGRTDQGYPTGDRRTELGYPTGDRRTERGYPTGDRRTERGYPTREGRTERGYSNGEGRTERGYSNGEGRTERGYPAGDRRTERGYPTGEGRTKRRVLEEEKSCRDEIQKGCELVVEVKVGNQRWGKGDKSNFYRKQGSKPHQAQGFPGAYNGASGLPTDDTIDLQHGIATHRADMSSHEDVMRRSTGDLAAMPLVQLECRRSCIYEGTQLTGDTCRTGTDEYETHSNPGPHLLHPDRFRTEPIQHPQHTLAQGLGPHLDSGPFLMRIGGAQTPGYEGFPRPLSVTASPALLGQPGYVGGSGPPLDPLPSHYQYREADWGHRPTMSQWTFPAPPRF